MAFVTVAPRADGVTQNGFAPYKPTVTVHGGMAGAVMYNRATQHFVVRVSPSITAPMREIDGSVVKEVDVVFSRAK
jgi:hypothetical protein